MYISFHLDFNCMAVMRQDMEKNIMIDSFLPIYVNLSYIIFVLSNQHAVLGVVMPNWHGFIFSISVKALILASWKSTNQQRNNYSEFYVCQLIQFGKAKQHQGMEAYELYDKLRVDLNMIACKKTTIIIVQYFSTAACQYVFRTGPVRVKFW